MAISLDAYSTSCWTSFHDKAVSRERGTSEIEFVVDRSRIIFIGSAESIGKEVVAEGSGKGGHVSEVVTLFDVEESIKGKITGKNLVTSGNICSCKYDFEAGVSYLIFSTDRKGILYLDSCV
ncbi:hypothetical protein ACJJI4_07675 [Microbulbifer sp. TRSA002]|uniref:hypothetical protein n=1 Tax=Microbulbifer sp. TRSA002 TaxID=3243382 RepID=UPI0040391F0A